MITGVVLARDEERNIVSCLQALRPHVAELILIDMVSSDRTVQLARPYVDRVLTHPLVDNFDAARNIAIPAAIYEWLWFVDADEHIPMETGRQVNELIRTKGNEFEAITIPFKTFFCGHWMQHNGWWPGYTCCRVLKRGHFEFSKMLHGGVQLSGRELRFPASPDTAIAHYSFCSLAHYVAKFNRYTTIEAKQLYEQGRSYNWRAAIRAMMQDLWMSYEFHDAREDGTWGWVVSWQSSQYRWMSYTKLLDEVRSHNKPQPESAPQSLSEVLVAMEDDLAYYRRLKPQLPLGLVVHCELQRANEWTSLAAARLLALARLGRPMQWRNPVLADLANDDASVDPFLLALQHARRPGHSVSVFVDAKRVPCPDEASRFSVYWPAEVSSSTAFTSEEVATLRQFDAIWVSSEAAKRHMRRFGIADEHLDVVPPWIDTGVFTPVGPQNGPDKRERDEARLLTILGRDTTGTGQRLLNALHDALREIKTPVTLLLASSEPNSQKSHADSPDSSGHDQGVDSGQRHSICWMKLPKRAHDKAQLLRWIDGLVLATDDNGLDDWGLMALACGRPVVAIDRLAPTGGPVNDAWITASIECNSLLDSSLSIREPEPQVDGSQSCPVSVCAAVEQLLAKRSAVPLNDVASYVHELSGDVAGRTHLQSAIARLEDRLRPITLSPINPNQLRVSIEGEVFASGSLSNINEVMAEGLGAQSSFAVRIDRRFINPVSDKDHPRAHHLAPYLKREFLEGAEVTIRHAYPPNWEPPSQGVWVHIQPWEFGYLPRQWLAPLRDHVTEVWAPSEYVRRVYVSSGVDPEKIQVIPNGCDPNVFRPDAPPLRLTTSKSWRFLFVGGAIPRKGIDRVLDAYLAEFRRNEDVCLVIKDMGAKSFYRNISRQRIFEALQDKSAPEIVYISDDFLASQLASLYTACNCLAAPYRGEGFGLPVLEAMACGLPPIVPKGGATDDFVTDATGYRLPAREVPIHDMPDLCQSGLEFDIAISDVRAAMRAAFEDRADAQSRGRLASEEVRAKWTWDASISRMTKRLWALAEIYLNKTWKGVTSAYFTGCDDEHLTRQSEGFDERAVSTAPATMTVLPDAVTSSAASASSRPRCAVLIQMATGAHKQFLEITHQHHEAYAVSHGMDYWRLDENPAEPKRASWGKITLLLRALQEGYDRAIWLDADAVIMRPEVNLALICRRGIGLVQHPNPVHWNAGFLVAAKSPLVERLLAEIDSRPDNESPWMEQLVLNELAKQPEFRAALEPLSPTFNATPGAIVVPHPVVLAAHGLPFEQRLNLVQSWLREVKQLSPSNRAPLSGGFRATCREEFADLLNGLGLTDSAVEVGVLRGEFSREFLDRWSGSRLYLVDPWGNVPDCVDITNLTDEEHEQALAETHKNLAPHSGRYVVCRQLSAEAATRFADGSLDFVFIDANHEYAAIRSDLWRWYPKVRPGGILAGHDFLDGLNPDGEYGVNFAVREFEQQTGLKAISTDEGRWASWYFYRI
jgi:glycosyltransferase involved in cell wall biosynthesis